MARLRITVPDELTFELNVAGPRESKVPGIQAKTKAFLSEVLLVR